MSEIKERYTAVCERIIQAAQRAGRDADDITLVAVSKTWPAETVLAGYEAGIRHFGENRPEELAEKRAEVEKRFLGLTVALSGISSARYRAARRTWRLTMRTCFMPWIEKRSLAGYRRG